MRTKTNTPNATLTKQREDSNATSLAGREKKKKSQLIHQRKQDAYEHPNRHHSDSNFPFTLRNGPTLLLLFSHFRLQQQQT
jgi:hypothetical protein